MKKTAERATEPPRRGAKFIRCANCKRAKSESRGWCDTCYRRWLRNADPSKVYRPWQKIKERIHERKL